MTEKIKSILEQNGRYFNFLNKNYQLLTVSIICSTVENYENIYSPSNNIEEVLCKRIEEAEKIINTMYVLGKDYQALTIKETENSFFRWFDVLILGAFIHAITYNENIPFVSLMFPREHYSENALNCGIGSQEQEVIWQTVESALGSNGPQKLKAVPNTPAALFDLAIFIKNKGCNFDIHYDLIEMEEKLNGK